jgi:hypothetical protein
MGKTKQEAAGLIDRPVCGSRTFIKENKIKGTRVACVRVYYDLMTPMGNNIYRWEVRDWHDNTYLGRWAGGGPTSDLHFARIVRWCGEHYCDVKIDVADVEIITPGYEAMWVNYAAADETARRVGHGLGRHRDQGTGDQPPDGSGEDRSEGPAGDQD